MSPSSRSRPCAYACVKADVNVSCTVVSAVLQNAQSICTGHKLSCALHGDTSPYARVYTRHAIMHALVMERCMSCYTIARCDGRAAAPHPQLSASRGGPRR